MKPIRVIICTTLWSISVAMCCGSFLNAQTQQHVRYYTLAELDTATIESVLAINLSKSKLVELPAIIFRFECLEYLNVSKNKLTHIDSVAVFSRLRSLNAGKNKLDHFPVAICRLSELERLELYQNNIASIPSCIGHCKKIKSIDLWGTLIETLPQEMASLPSLKEINLLAVQLNEYQQKHLRETLPHVQLKMGAPCNCGN